MKFDAYRDNIEKADDRASDANYQLKSAEERAAKYEEEADSYKRRIALLTDEFNKTQEKLEGNQYLLAHLGDKIKREQGTGKELEGIELETDDQLSDLEFKVKEALTRMEEKVREYNEICRKLTKTEYDLGRAQERCEKAEEKVEESEDNLKSAAESQTKLEQKDEEASEREGEQEEKIAFMEGELKPIIESCEEFEERERKLERYLDELTMDIDNWREKKDGVEQEMEEIKNLADSM